MGWLGDKLGNSVLGKIGRGALGVMTGGISETDTVLKGAKDLMTPEKLAQQQALAESEKAAALQAQTQAAIAQQSQGLGMQRDFVNALQAQNGIGNQSQVYNQLQGIANGTGPNPAQAALAQATGANVANQAALMAGQRGAGANAGLIARQAGMQGANIQQNAAGQAATMQAQQSLNAIGQAGGMANQMVGNQANALQGYQQGAQGITNATQNNQGVQLGVMNQDQNRQAAIQAQNAAADAQGMQNLMGVVGGLAGAGMKMATGGASAAVPAAMQGAKMAGGPMDNMGSGMPPQTAMYAAEGGAVPGPSSFVGKHLGMKPQLAKGGAVPAMVSPGEVYVAPSKVAAKDPMAAGEKIPGKPKVGGAKNSYANDTVPKTLEAGGIVIPRSVTQGKDPHKAAAKFVAAVLSKKGLK